MNFTDEYLVPNSTNPKTNIPGLKFTKTISKYNDSDIPSSLRDHLNTSQDFDIFELDAAEKSDSKKVKKSLFSAEK